ncbi:MAG: hypothetical protein ABSE59_02915 [Opitutaceae bacterium]|jgi:hypothetical protein
MTNDLSRFLKGLLVLLLLAIAGYYGQVHWRALWSSEPLTLRESAFVIDTRGYLDLQAARPYTLESIPKYTNVYGIGYLWGAAPFCAYLPFSEYVSLRLANTFYLGLLLFVLCLGSSGGALSLRIFGLGLVYALFVSSPSLAAGPDILACLLYTLAWVTVVAGDFTYGALFFSILLSFLAVLTKPYCVLAVGGIGSYLFLFRSKKAGIGYALGALALFVPGLWLIHSRYPYYFFETFTINKITTTFSLVFGLHQWKDFILLVPFPFGLFAGATAQLIWRNYRTIRLQWSFDAPLLPKSLLIGPYDFGALVALTVLSGLLSWHGGAYLTYFWHLLLPLLALGAMSRPASNLIWPCLNLAVLLWLRPPLPPVQTSADWIILGQLVAEHPRGYVDPYFEPLVPPGSSITVDNAQSEYSTAIGAARGSPPCAFIVGITLKIWPRRSVSVATTVCFLFQVFLPPNNSTPS